MNKRTWHTLKIRTLLTCSMRQYNSSTNYFGILKYWPTICLQVFQRKLWHGNIHSWTNWFFQRFYSYRVFLSRHHGLPFLCAAKGRCKFISLNVFVTSVNKDGNKKTNKNQKDSLWGIYCLTGMLMFCVKRMSHLNQLACRICNGHLIYFVSTTMQYSYG